MSTDRLEQRLPDVLTELSLPRVPDYVDDLLRRTERMPQRPGWAFLERWLPVSTLTTAFRPVGRSPLRLVVALAILLALILASLAMYAGSQRDGPSPLGLARNGLVITATATGDLVSVDPRNGAQQTLVNGPNICCAQISRDGRRVAFLDLPTPDADPTRLRITEIGGSIVQDVPADLLRGLVEYTWAPDGTRLLLTFNTHPAILDVGSGTFTTIDAPGPLSRASWIGTTGDILLTSRVSDTKLRVSRWSVTRGVTQIAELEYAVDAPKMSPDGSRFLYFIWGPEPRLQGRLHVVDLATSEDREVSPPEPPGSTHETEWENPTWSPDGSHIAAELYTTQENHIAVIPATGGDWIVVGPSFPTGTGGAAMQFSPDGKSLLVTYRSDHTTWLLPASGGEGVRVRWTVGEEVDWQRLAP